MGLVAHEEIAAIGVLSKAIHVRAETLVRTDEDVEESRLDEAIHVLLHRLAIGFGQCERLDGPGSQPLDEFVFPVFDE